MPIEQTQVPNKAAPTADKGSEGQQGPLLNITLPAPASGDPSAPLPIGQHNAAAQKNFKQVADIMLAIINNQKSMSAVIVEQGKAIKELQENNKLLAENIRKLLQENENDGRPKPTK
jgi:hypothetical protein